MQPSPRFVDNHDGTITDSQTELTWTREDVWQMENRWVTWDEAKEYAVHLGHKMFSEQNDWRLPSRKDILSLYDETLENKDKYGNVIHLSPVFPEGPQAAVWCEESSSKDEGYTLDFRTGKIRVLFKSKCPRMSARAVRGKPLPEL